jgi:ribosome maturation factor RimP
VGGVPTLLYAGERGEVVGVNVSERVRAVVEAPLAASGLELVDVEHQASVLRITVDRPGGVDLDTISAASTLVSAELDRNDVVPGRYVLEVSSPGVERTLRTPDHFRRFVGTTVAVRTRPGAEGDRRVEGVLEAADDDGIVVAGRRIAYADVDRARTVFEWGGAKAKPGHKARRAS